MDETPIAIMAHEMRERRRASNYPSPFAERMAGRVKRPLGDPFGLRNFGVNLTRLSPGAVTSLHHVHSRQDEFVYVLEGTPTLVVGSRESLLAPGMVAGFPAGGAAHHIENRTTADCVLLEIGDRGADDEVSYPDDDIMVVTGADGSRIAAHKDGTPYA